MTSGIKFCQLVKYGLGIDTGFCSVEIAGYLDKNNFFGVLDMKA